MMRIRPTPASLLRAPADIAIVPSSAAIDSGDPPSGTKGLAKPTGARFSGRLPAAPPGTDAAWLPLAFMAAHVPLAVLLDNYSPLLPTAHAVATFGFGIWMALRGRTDRVILALGYLTGAEVLWRMSSAQVNWEFGKYAAAAIMVLALLRSHRLRAPIWPLAYFTLLLPSTALTLTAEPWTTARDQISFNLSGPFALAVAAWFFSQVPMSAKDLRNLVLAIMAPGVGIATLAATGAFYGNATFSDGSNLIASGGFGPNQVSGALGLATLLSLFIMLDGRAPRLLRLAMGAATVGLAAQTALTFSRGGLYMAAGGAAVAACFALHDPRLRFRLLPLAVVFFAIGNYFVVPYLDALTEGQMAVRFQDTQLTGRDRMIRADIELWKDNPLMGVGPGEGRLQRGTFFVNDGGTISAVQTRAVAAHTEFSRLLSEHGAFGLIALVLLVMAALMNVHRAPDSKTRALLAGLICWSALYMFSNAMRSLAPSFVFAIGFAPVLAEGAAAAEAAVGGTTGRLSASVRSTSRLRPLIAGHPMVGRRGLLRAR